MKVINLWAGPGAGKSTTAAGLFFVMKTKGMQCELVHEYAKQLTWAERQQTLNHQDYVFAKQNSKLEYLRDKVDWAITDSPLLLSEIYASDDTPESLIRFFKDKFDTYHNYNFFIDRTKEYSPIGRNQTKEEAIEKDQEVLSLLDKHSIPYVVIPGDYEAPWKIFERMFGYWENV